MTKKELINKLNRRKVSNDYCDENMKWHDIGIDAAIEILERVLPDDFQV